MNRGSFDDKSFSRFYTNADHSEIFVTQRDLSWGIASFDFLFCSRNSKNTMNSVLKILEKDVRAIRIIQTSKIKVLSFEI